MDLESNKKYPRKLIWLAGSQRERRDLGLCGEVKNDLDQKGGIKSDRDEPVMVA